MSRIVVFLLMIHAVFAAAQTGTDFWFAAPYITEGHEGNAQVLFCITAPDLDAHVVINQPANPAFTPIDTLVPAGKSVVISMTKSQYYSKNTDGPYTYNNFFNFDLAAVTKFQKVLNNGIHIYSNNRISVYYNIAGGWNMDQYVLKGTSGLGCDFVCPFQNQWPNDSRWSDAHCQLDIVATENNTEVFIVPTVQTTYSADGSSLASNAGDTIRVILNKGQSFAVRAKGKAGNQHLGGTHVWSKFRKIAVTLTDDSVNPTGFGCADVIGDQLISSEYCGRRYLVMRSKMNASIDGWCFITATQTTKQTKIFAVGLGGGFDTVLIGTINPPGKSVVSYQIPAGKNFVYLYADQPICVLHVAGYGCEGGGAILPPVENCTGSMDVSFYRLNRPNEEFFMNIMVPHGAQDAFKIITECNDTIPVPASYFEKVPGSGQFSDPNSADRGWWVIKDSAKRFGCNLVGSCSSNKPGCQSDGEGVPLAAKNGINVKVNAVSRLVNTKDFFHLGIYSGGTTTTSQYGYFSSFRINEGDGAPETGTNNVGKCEGDTAMLYSTGGLSYEWFYDSTGLGTNLSKKYLAPGEDKKSVCRAWGFQIPPGDSALFLNFRVNKKRPVCLQDVTSQIRVIVSPAPPVPSFSVDKTKACSGELITFTPTSSYTGQHLWFYRDPKSESADQFSSSKTIFTGSFNNPYGSVDKKITVSLFYSSSRCGRYSPAKELIITPGISAGFEFTPVSGCNPISISFTDTSRGPGINNYSWAFGDGASDAVQNPSHVYSAPIVATEDTVYHVSLSVKNPANCESSVTRDIHVYQSKAGFTADTATCSPATDIMILDASFGHKRRWDLHYGDGTVEITNTLSPVNTWTFPANNTSSVRIDTIIQHVYTFYNPKYPNDTLYACSKTQASLVKIYPASLCGTAFTLTVNSGLGSGSYMKNKYVAIVANTIAGKVFEKWTGDTQYLSDSTTAVSVIVMPTANISITAVYKTLYTLTVGNGSGSGIHFKGDTITVTADPPAPHYTFYKWSGDTKWLTDSTSITMKLIMPASDVSISAEYRKFYTLTVNNGSGGGEYIAGTNITVKAEKPSAGMVFTYWTGDTSLLADPYMDSTSLVMPAADIHLYPNYANLCTLTVSNGKGSGVYVEGSKVTVEAGIITGKLFERWTGDTAFIGDCLNDTTFVTLGKLAVNIAASYQQLYFLNVISGSGSGWYKQGTVVAVRANIPTCVCPSFSRWTGDLQYMTNASEYETKIKMPASDIEVKAEYETGLNENNAEVCVYPVPANDKLFLTNLSSVEFISIVDVQGKVRKLIQPLSAGTTVEIDIRVLESGMYLLKIVFMDGKEHVSRILIAK